MEKNKYLDHLLNMSPVKHDLLAAVIALVRASVENNMTTDKTVSILAAALDAFGYGDDSECEKQSQLVRQEKNRLAPDCAGCPNPCARTAEYPITEFLEENVELQRMKAEMLFFITEHFKSMGINSILEALFMFGYEKDAERFREYLGMMLK